jgi:DNA-binding SARP family transcriptional activator
VSWLDVEQFEYHWRNGLHLEKEGKVDEAFIQHETAEAMYKGEYLEDDLYKDWTSLPREALKDIYLTIVGRLADYSMLKEDHIASINYCQKILAKDPCREDAYQRLMCCYCRLGQRNRAIAWYHICERTIKRELNVSPARAL